ncbi:hypothetical protein QNI16_16725 [Cytophagaceae bacterium YF14B1]|uniref:Uncharacterized protein n=1 Tax=Xanthocytophaga flava TaxID=3048013 RepID=A0AAE3QRF8_9BACT|nr:hypothetical protein [Xanthocytophaga flavus]MDJ1482150.1 hypothetical protein [Xanthocytophaga flavus]
MESKINLQNLTRENIFQIPEQYFASLPSAIQKRLAEASNTALNNDKPLLEYSAIEETTIDHIFITPSDYFENLYQKIQSKIPNQSDSPIKLNLSALDGFESELGNKHGHTVPENYFETLPNRIMARVASSETTKSLDFEELDNAESGILASIPKQNIFQIPDNYFEKLNIQLDEDDVIEESTSEKTKSIRLIPSWVRYTTVAAASVLLLMTGYWFYSSTTSSSQECTELLCNLTDEEILHYLEKQDTRLTTTQMPAISTKHTDSEIVDPIDISDEDILNAAEGIE